VRSTSGASRRPPATGLLALAVVLVLLVAACSTSGSPSATTAPTASGRPKPNIVFILTDDLAMAEMPYLPHVRELLGDQGATYDNYFISNSECCPSRTTTLRGQYSHNNDVLDNTEAQGGFETAYRLGVEKHTIATTLSADGYRTALFGKYLNGYPHTAPSWRYIPPGWDDWNSPIQGAISEYNYTLNSNGTHVHYGSAPSDYATDVYTNMSLSYATTATKSGSPFFLYYGYYPPHSPATPAPRHVHDFPGLKAPHTTSYDEADNSDKPSYVRALAPLSPQEMALDDHQFALRVRSLQAIDDAVVKIVARLKALGQLDNTYIVFTSDNGYHLGQHRLPPGKGMPYEEDIRVPMIIRGPGIKPGSHVSELTGNVDLASTFEDMSGAKPLGFEDGRSMLPYATDPTGQHAVRQSYLIEHWPDTANNDDADRAGAQTEPPDPSVGNLPKGQDYQSLTPQYAGIRTTRYTYVEWANGDRELYDLQTDPAEMTNIYPTASAALRGLLATRLHQLQACKAAQCRQVDQMPTP
jgi:N-acetylglucosamine-6-sulfatase